MHPTRLGLPLLAAFGLLAGCSPTGGGNPPPPAAPVEPASPGPAGTPTATATAPTAPTPAGATAPTTATPAAGSREEAFARARKAIDQGLHWLRQQQAEDGSYGNYPGVTAMVLSAFLQSHRKYREEDGPFIRRATEYLAALAKPNGAIFDKNLPTYNTALAVLALHQTGNPAYREIIKKGQLFLIGIQAAESNQYRPQDKFYGGIGYGSSERPDLPNLQFAIEALALSDYDGDRAVFERAIKFIERCQNRSESNDQEWAGEDGGFIYQPGSSKAGGTKSYGSMTHAGIMSLMYSNVDRNDPRVQDALGWIKANWDLETHPGMGLAGLYFYYHTLAKALSVLGVTEITDDRGQTHDWAVELIDAVLARQDPAGFWVNSDANYWESNKLLASARALLALEGALGLTHEAIASRVTPTPAAQPGAPAAAQPGAATSPPPPPAPTPAP